MKHILTILLLLFSALAFSQHKSRSSIAFQLQPELTLHKDYYYMVLERQPKTKATFNAGAEISFQHFLSDRLFAEAGIGYLSRKIKGEADFDQSALPAPYGSSSAEQIYIQSVSYRTLQIPVNIGYDLLAGNETNLFLTAGLTANYLLNGYYDVGIERYERAYKKNYLQGISLNVGAGTDHQLSDKFSFTGRLSYSIINTAKEDAFLEGQNDERVELTHTYLRLSAGIRMVL